MAINTGWLIGVSEERKKEVSDTLRHSSIMRGQLELLIAKEIETMDTSPVADYDNSGWAYKQADRLGQLRAYRKILALLKQIN